MLFFGHFGITVGCVHALNGRLKTRVDLRAAALVALLPDLIDKPIGLLYPNTFGNHTRLMGHSIVFALSFLALYGLARLLRVVRPIHHVFIVWGAYWGHLLLDRIWKKDLHALCWPFYPWPPPLEIPPWIRWWHALKQPYNLGGELLGLSILVFLAVKYRLDRAGPRRKLLRNGVLGN